MVMVQVAILSFQFLTFEWKIATTQQLSLAKSENQHQSEFVSTFLFFIQLINAFVMLFNIHFGMNCYIAYAIADIPVHTVGFSSLSPRTGVKSHSPGGRSPSKSLIFP